MNTNVKIMPSTFSEDSKKLNLFIHEAYVVTPKMNANKSFSMRIINNKTYKSTQNKDITKPVLPKTRYNHEPFQLAHEHSIPEVVQLYLYTSIQQRPSILLDTAGAF